MCGLKKKLTFHLSRHTFATLTLTKGVSIESVSKMLGHTNIRTTQVYARITNTASQYFAIFKMGLHQACLDGYLRDDISAKLRSIGTEESRREYLTMDELNHLASIPCKNQTVKNAALFSALTGLRHCDIQKLKWHEIQQDGDKFQLHFTQKKTRGVEYMPISQQAVEICGKPQDADKYVFPDLPEVKQIPYFLNPWINAAGLKKKITFHCFRHTFATLQAHGHGVTIKTLYHFAKSAGIELPFCQLSKMAIWQKWQS
jgi:integrase